MKQIMWVSGLLLTVVLVSGCTRNQSQDVDNEAVGQTKPAEQTAAETVPGRPTAVQTVPAANVPQTATDSAVNQSQTAPVASQTAAPKVKEFTMTAKQWAFSPSTITVNKGDKVRLKIKSLDVNHGFSLPDFNVNLNLPPNQEQTAEFVANQAGTFTFRCSMMCGSGHSGMSGQLIVK